MHRDQRGDGASEFVLGQQEYAVFAQVGRRRAVKAGECLFRRGQRGSHMYVIVRGAVTLDFGDELLIKRLGERAFLGELCLLIGDHVSPADAWVSEDGELLEIGRDTFAQLMQREPKALMQFLRRSVSRIVRYEQTLIERLRRRNQELQHALVALRSTNHRLDETEALMRTDDLTGLTNRRGLLLRLEQLQQAGTLSDYALILVDCDRFKAINDTYGHLVGDRVLQSVANLLRAVAGKDDVACRLGGDEFCLLLRGLGREDVERVAGYIVDSARMLQRMHKNPPQMTSLSIGACLFGAEEMLRWEHFYARADQAMYMAKQRGGGCVAWLE